MWGAGEKERPPSLLKKSDKFKMFQRNFGYEGTIVHYLQSSNITFESKFLNLLKKNKTKKTSKKSMALVLAGLAQGKESQPVDQRVLFSFQSRACISVAGSLWCGLWSGKISLGENFFLKVSGFEYWIFI